MNTAEAMQLDNLAARAIIQAQAIKEDALYSEVSISKIRKHIEILEKLRNLIPPPTKCQG